MKTAKLKEDVPTMSAGSGQIAGIGVGPDGEPGVDMTQRRKKWKKDKQQSTPTEIVSNKLSMEEMLDELKSIDEDLRDWFGKGKTGGVGGGGWDRYNTKGERIGKCGDAEDRGGDGEGKPKCLSKEKAAQLRAKDGKNAIANAVKRKKSQDSDTDRSGTGNTPNMVSNRIGESVIVEKNVPTNPSLWSRAKSEAKKRFDVYPSAYANGWASKWYKARGGGWNTAEDSDNQTESVTEAYLTEIGDRPYPFQVTINMPHKRMQAQFTIPETGMVYKVFLWVTKHTNHYSRPGVPAPPPMPSEWEFGFGQYEPKDAAWDSPVTGKEHIIGNTGVEIPVFATVVAILKQFVRTVRPATIVYSAKDPSRQRLYARFTNLAHRLIPGYSGYVVSHGKYEIQRNDAVKEETESNTPTDREFGTDSLTRIYKKDTPGQTTHTEVVVDGLNNQTEGFMEDILSELVAIGEAWQKITTCQQCKRPLSPREQKLGFRICDKCVAKNKSGVWGNDSDDEYEEQIDITENDPCWDGYKMVGMKNKNGGSVPNCVAEVNEAPMLAGEYFTGSYMSRDRQFSGTILRIGKSMTAQGHLIIRDKKNDMIKDITYPSVKKAKDAWIKTFQHKKASEVSSLHEAECACAECQENKTLGEGLPVTRKQISRVVVDYMHGLAGGSMSQTRSMLSASNLSRPQARSESSVMAFLKKRHPKEEIIILNLDFLDGTGKPINEAADTEEDRDEVSEAAEYNGKTVTLNKPFRTPGAERKFGVYAKNDKDNVVLVRFGDPNMEIKRDDPDRRSNYRARHGCDNPGPKWKANYWSCRMWASKSVSDIISEDKAVLIALPKPSTHSDGRGFWKIGNEVYRASVNTGKDVYGAPLDKRWESSYNHFVRYWDGVHATHYVKTKDWTK